MEKIDQCYMWTSKLVPNINQPNSPWLVLKRIPVSEIRDPPNTFSDTPLSFTPISSPSSSSGLSSQSFSCSSCSSSPTSCSSSSSSSSPSQSSPTHSVVETEKWTCELVEGQYKIIIRRQLC